MSVVLNKELPHPSMMKQEFPLSEEMIALKKDP